MIKIGTLTFVLCLTASAGGPPQATEHWSKSYRDFHEIVEKINSQVARSYFPEIMIIRDGHTIASLQIDAFAAKVLHEADEVLLPYREGLQSCVESHQNEYRAAQEQSFEYFGWFLDNYVRTLVKSLGTPEEPEMVDGVRSRKVTTDRALYAFTRLLGGYLDERADRFKGMEPPHVAADRALNTALSDIGRRVFRLDLTQKFDRREVVEKGMKSQPILRDIASNEGGADLSLGLDPLTRLLGDSKAEPSCKITLPPRVKTVATSP